METKGHTPGEWSGSTGSFPESSGQGLVVSDSDGRNIAIVYDAKRDMALIEAAPELMAALKQINTPFNMAALAAYAGQGYADAVKNEIAAAIRKATEG